MKLQELRTMIREVIAEEIANESNNKKKIAIAEIKRIIAENELTEDEIDEALFSSLFGGTPEQKAAKLEDELKTKAPETYKTWVDAITKLGWKEKKLYNLLADSIEKYAKGYKYPSDGVYSVRNNKIFFNTKSGGGTGLSFQPGGTGGN